MQFGVNQKNRGWEGDSLDAQNRRIVAVCLVLVTLLALAFFLSPNKDSSGPKLAAEEFLNAVLTQNLPVAREKSCGTVKFNISTNQGNSDYTLASLTTTVEAHNGGLASTLSRVETKDGRNNADVHWFRLYLVDKGSWLVYRIEETDPVVKEAHIDSRAVASAEKAFNSYVREVMNGGYEAAASYLIGRARNSHEQSANILALTPVIKKIDNLEFQIVTGSKTELVLEADYQVDGRNVSVLVAFHRTLDGWKIYNIAQI